LWGAEPNRDRSVVLTVTGVAHTYPGQGATSALRDVSLMATSGELVAIVGSNGGGKSTLLDILSGLLTPSSGTVRLTVDATEVPFTALQRGGVRQRSLPCFATVREHVGIGAGVDGTRLTADDDAITAAVRHASGDRDAPGLDHDPTALSLGQLRRLDIARALIQSESMTLVIDELTSGLDPAASDRLRRAMVAHAREKSSLSFLVTHILSEARAADRIIVMRDGSVVEFGTHDDLMRVEGEYFRLFSAQAQGYE
jgi:ATP-binding cassette subfamily B protein